jgi:transposase
MHGAKGTIRYSQLFSRIGIKKYVPATDPMEDVKEILKDYEFVKFTMKRKNNKYSQIIILTTCINMSLKTIFKIIRERSYIENSIFNYLKNECHLNHCYVHGGNAVEVMTCLIFIASNLMQLFYYRRLKETFPTRRELACLLIKGLYLLKYDSKLVLSSA